MALEDKTESTSTTLSDGFSSTKQGPGQTPETQN